MEGWSGFSISLEIRFTLCLFQSTRYAGDLEICSTIVPGFGQTASVRQSTYCIYTIKFILPLTGRFMTSQARCHIFLHYPVMAKTHIISGYCISGFQTLPDGRIIERCATQGRAGINGSVPFIPGNFTKCKRSFTCDDRRANDAVTKTNASVSSISAKRARVISATEVCVGLAA